MTGPVSEFDLIRRYFAEPAGTSPDVRLGIGDDGALLVVQAGHELVVTVDTLVEGTHYYPDHPPASLGHKALAANLSDLAAMGADPLGVVLSLTLPSVDHDWLAAFSRGFMALAEQTSVPLVGGDTTRGPGAVSVTALGQVPVGQALRRTGARPGDRLVVSGALGGAAAGFAFERQRREQGQSSPDEAAPSCARLFWPNPRLALGRGLRNRARAALDISDGLLADLGHLCAASGCGARVDWSQVPVDPLLDGQPEETVRDGTLAGGEDYELLFALPPTEPLELLSLSVRTSLTVIGEFTSGSEIEVVDADGARLDVARRGHDHFAG
ncbi:MULTISPECIES: thiamine-phosphate kinase [unclassified Thioalkalivibrio]|uniref:thiamine-phosphate kinase n=1 Tax=unclassified Thioalkalivibrio TaxID=2621013 RepID=UPI00037B5876|nr:MULTISPECIES: thiamine-phosphate kinase [unclassified Thioalkalivibrio]